MKMSAVRFPLPASAGRVLISLLLLVLFWELLVLLTGAPHFILPGPVRVAETLTARFDRIMFHAGITGLEVVLGLLLGTFSGILSALTLAYFRLARLWLLPLLVATQAIPVFALAPVLVLWLGYGILPKIVMATLIIFFPVTAAFLDGLRRTEPGWLDLARAMNASPARILWHIRIPAALPALASGLRVAAAIAPIGAVVGEWVGSSAGLGGLMMQANARVKTDLMFAALIVLAVMALALYYSLDALLRRLLPWVPDNSHITDNSSRRG